MKSEMRHRRVEIQNGWIFPQRSSSKRGIYPDSFARFLDLHPTVPDSGNLFHIRFGGLNLFRQSGRVGVSVCCQFADPAEGGPACVFVNPGFGVAIVVDEDKPWGSSSDLFVQRTAMDHMGNGFNFPTRAKIGVDLLELLELLKGGHHVQTASPDEAKKFVTKSSCHLVL